MARANSTIDGEWTSTTAGGCPKHASWVRNPQYQLQPTVPDASYTLELTQLEPESSRHPIGLWVMVAASPTERVTKLSKSQTVAKTKFKVCRQVSLLVTLPPRPDGLPYIVAVSTFEPNQLAAFTLSLSSALDPAAQLHPLQSRPLSASLTRPPAAASSSDAATAAAAPLVAGGDDGTGAAVLPAGAACGASVAQLDLERAQQDALAYG